MAFDSDTRNKLAKMVADARALLKNEFTQQLQEIYGIQPDGKISALEKLAHLDDEQRDIAMVLRERVAYISGGISDAKKPIKAAVERMTREQSFTVLNRFAALRMCEERGFLQQCIGGRLQSKGFQVYLKTAGSGLGGQYERFRTFIFSIFDEIAIDLGILFDRFSPFGLLFPRETALNELLEIINRKELEHLWPADEAIGWIYQYFNSPEERKAMRKASAAPRNSRELAVRNQFFTPRYVVEFLTDNTLGRIWYEMRQGQTALKEKCRYLVRRPNEVFLKPGQESPKEDDTSDENLSQEELLNKTTYIPFRAPKDPRDLKILDPACGSGHFLLYAFDLLQTIYEEAWQNDDSPPLAATGRNLRQDFDSLDKLRTAIPELILRWNLHGIDIDPRAVQIAALALWLRAQRSWQKQGIKAVERPRLTRSNIVCAEPMPGDANMLKEFTDGLKPKVLGQLVEVIFKKMKLAGEAGSLLKIEEEIKDAVSEARKQWEAKPKPEQAGLFPELEKPKYKQQEIQFDVSEIDDVKFWDRAETLILQSLQDYAERAENGLENRRKMFAEDAAQGFAFIDLCRKSFDVVLMNPPFGEPSRVSKKYLYGKYPNSKNDLFAISVERGRSFLLNRGGLGAITSRTGFFLSSFENWRKKTIFRNSKLDVFSDLGHGVMDTAMVQAAAYCITRDLDSKESDSSTVCFRLLDKKNKETELKKIIENKIVESGPSIFIISQAAIKSIPNFPFAYWAKRNLLDVWKRLQVFDLEDEGRATRCGIGTLDDFRFIRLIWEIAPVNFRKQWADYFSGGSYSPFYEDFPTIVNWKNDGKEIKQFVTQKVGSASRKVQGSDHYFKRGFVFPRRTKAFAPKVMPEKGIFSTAGQAGFLKEEDLRWGIALLSSSVCNSLIALSQGSGEAPQFEVGLVKRLPWPKVSISVKNELENLFNEAVKIKQKIDVRNETTRIFLGTNLLPNHRKLVDYFREKLLLTRNYRNELNRINLKIDRLACIVYMVELNDISITNGDDRDSSKKASDKITLSNGALAINEPELEDECHSIISYLFGSILGRWDIRNSIGEKEQPELPDPFDPLPACPPGMLQNDKGIPAEQLDMPATYPLIVNAMGILVDDLGHPEDIIDRVRKSIEFIWNDDAGYIEQEACDLLGVRSLRDYFRKPNEFFANHLKRYSKSRRKAPIYWPLSTESNSYTLWLYYHRLTDQTLFTCANDYVNPKIETTSRDIERLQKELTEAGNAQKRNDLEKLQDFRRELIDFRDELLRVAKLPYKPNLNDGVLITASPLWRLFRLKKWQDDLKACWEKLKSGDYDWAHLAYSIWPDRVREKCKTDRSIAIAHDLEEICKVQPKKSHRG